MELSIGRRIKALRKEKGLTQEQLAELFGVSFQAVSKWETGAAYPDIEMLPGIARFFGVTTDDLLGVDVSRTDEMVRGIHDEAARLFHARDYASALPLLRKAAAQFPMSEELQYCLSWALRGNCREDPAHEDEAACILQKLLENAKSTVLRLKAARDLVNCYYTKSCANGLDNSDLHKAMAYAERLPAFEVCREYSIGRGNLLEGQALVERLTANIDLFAGAVIECLEYFASEKLNGRLFTKEQAGALTAQAAAEKIALVRSVMTGSPPAHPPPAQFSAYA